MHSPVTCVSERASLRQVARMLVVNHIGSLPVLGAKKALVGMITESDVFKIMAGMAHPRRPAKAKRKPAKAALPGKMAGKKAGKPAGKKAGKTAGKVRTAKRAARKPAKAASKAKR
jgi:CBS-domain-containing membrane protein